MKKILKPETTKPQYVVTTDITYAQVDSWFGHCRRDLKLDLIYPEDGEGKTYPCIVWICGGAWQRMDKAAHLAYLGTLAQEGFVVASVEYRTSNEGTHPMQLCDIKAAIRYLRAYAKRYRINSEKFGVMGESAGGYLTCMAALDQDKKLDTGEYLEYSSQVQAACPWYPPTEVYHFPYDDVEKAQGTFKIYQLPSGEKYHGVRFESMDRLNVMTHPQEAYENSPVSKVTPDAPPFLLIHGTKDSTVPFSQSEELYDALEAAGCDVTLLALDGAEHADLMFFQDEVWQQIIAFFKRTL